MRLIYAVSLVLSSFEVRHAAAGEPAEIEGRWLQRCLLGQPHGGVQNDVSIKDDSLEFTRRHAEDPRCRLPSFDFVWSATFTVRGEAPGLSGAKNIDFTLKTITVIPRQAATARDFNASRFCGKDGWAVNQPQEVTGGKCGGNQLGRKGYQAYNIFKVDGDLLYLHFEASVGRESDRPTKLSPEFYRRQ